MRTNYKDLLSINIVFIFVCLTGLIVSGVLAGLENIYSYIGYQIVFTAIIIMMFCGAMLFILITSAYLFYEGDQNAKEVVNQLTILKKSTKNTAQLPPVNKTILKTKETMFLEDKTCIKCGSKVLPNSIFCSFCGSKV